MNLKCIWCIAAILIIVQNVYVFILACNKNNVVKQKFLSTLSEKEKSIYFEKVDERKSIYFCGLILGFIISLLYVAYRNKFNIKTLTTFLEVPWICIIVTFTIIITYIYYFLYPKSRKMITYLKTKSQRDAWKDVSQYMQNMHMNSIFTSVIVLILLWIASYNKKNFCNL